MIVDLHSDLLCRVEEAQLRGDREVYRALLRPDFDAAGLRVIVLAVWLPTAFVPEGALRAALRLIEHAHRLADESDGALRIVTTRRGLDEALAEGAVAALLSLEGCEPLGREPELIRAFHRLGVRLAGLTWNRANDFADGAAEDRACGITPLGRRLIGELGALGMALDLSHLTDLGAEQALAQASGPVLLSHSNPRAAYANARNAPDWLLSAVAERGGLCGVSAQPVFLGTGPPTERIAEHLIHVAAVAGAGAPALGMDFTDDLPEGPPEPAGLGLPAGSDLTLNETPEPSHRTAFAEIADAMRGRGADAAAIEAALGGNALRFLRGILG